MGYLSKKDIADKLEISTRHLSVILKRAVDKGHVVMRGEKFDPEKPNNKFWLQNQLDKKAVKKPPPSSKQPAAASQKGKKAPADPANSLEAQKISMQILKMQLEVEKLKIQNNKTRGDVIPSGLMRSLFLQHDQSILTESANTVTDILRIFAKRRELTETEVAEIKKEYTLALNNSVKKASELTINSLKNIIDEYSNKRGVGNRD